MDSEDLFLIPMITVKKLHSVGTGQAHPKEQTKQKQRFLQNKDSYCPDTRGPATRKHCSFIVEGGRWCAFQHSRKKGIPFFPTKEFDGQTTAEMEFRGTLLECLDRTDK